MSLFCLSSSPFCVVASALLLSLLQRIHSRPCCHCFLSTSFLSFFLFLRPLSDFRPLSFIFFLLFLSSLASFPAISLFSLQLLYLLISLCGLECRAQTTVALFSPHTRLALFIRNIPMTVPKSFRALFQLLCNLRDTCRKHGLCSAATVHSPGSV